MFNKCMQSTEYQVIRKLHRKATVSYNYTPMITAKIPESDNTDRWRERRAARARRWRDCETDQSHFHKVRQVLTKLNVMLLFSH